VTSVHWTRAKHTCTYAYMHTRKHAYMHTCKQLYKHTIHFMYLHFCWICTYTKMKNKLCTVYTCVYIDTYKHMHITCLRVYMYISICWLILFISLSPSLSPSLSLSLLHARYHATSRAHIYTHTCTYAHEQGTDTRAKLNRMSHVACKRVTSHVNVACRFCYWSELESKTAGFASKCR